MKIRMIDPNKIKIKWVTSVEDKIWDNSEDFFEKIKHDVLGQVALELPLEGGVAQNLLVDPEPLHGNPLQVVGVVSGCENTKLLLSREDMCLYLPAAISMSAMISGSTTSSSLILQQRRSIIPGRSYLSATQATIWTLRSDPVKSPV